VARFFLHVQGSGRLRLADGRILRVNYSGSNGLPYRSIGRHMLDQQLIGSGSAGSMKAFLRTTSPQVRDRILFENPRYIFFREVPLREEDGPIGSLGVPLVPGRSIAADPRYVPPGRSSTSRRSRRCSTRAEPRRLERARTLHVQSRFRRSQFAVRVARTSTGARGTAPAWRRAT
jgi:hypothetical protein